MESTGGFAAGTLVHTGKGLVPIEQIKVGDMVLSKTEGGKGDLVYQSVTETFVSEDKEIWALFHQDTACSEDWQKDLKVVFVTGGHPIWVQEYEWSGTIDPVVKVNNWLRPDELFEKSAIAVAKVPADGKFVKMYAQPILTTSYPNIGYMVSSWDYDPEFVVEFNDNKAQAYDISYIFDGMGIEPDVDVSDSLNKILLGLEELDVVQKFMTCFNQKTLGGFYDRYKARVYNLIIADCHTYFVEERGIWVHNTCNINK